MSRKQGQPSILPSQICWCKLTLFQRVVEYRGKLFSQRCCNLFGQGRISQRRFAALQHQCPVCHRNHPACRNAAWIWQEQQRCAQIAGDKTAILQRLPLHLCADRDGMVRTDMCGQLRGLNRQHLCQKRAQCLVSDWNPHLCLLLYAGIVSVSAGLLLCVSQ